MSEGKCILLTVDGVGNIYDNSDLLKGSTKK